MTDVSQLAWAVVIFRVKVSCQFNYYKQNCFPRRNKKGCSKILAKVSKHLPFLFDSPLSPSSEEINSKDCARGIFSCLRDAVGLPLGEPGRDLLVVLSASLLFSFRWLHAFMGDCELLTFCEPTLRLRRVLKGDILTPSSTFWLLRESNEEFWREYAGCPLSDLWTKRETRQFTCDAITIHNLENKTSPITLNCLTARLKWGVFPLFFCRHISFS